MATASSPGAVHIARGHIGNQFGSVQSMLPHSSSGDASLPRQGRRKTRPMDLAWLEERALNYVARWEASAASVASLLERKIHARCERTGESPDLVLEMIPTLVTQLIERGYVDDHRFAAGAIERQHRRGDSTARIRARLGAKGISESLLDELLGQVDPEIELRSAWNLARRRQLGPYCKDANERRESRDRHLGVLCRQGFEHETALEIVDADAPPESV